MQSGKDFIGKLIISIDDGRKVGTVKDLYLDSDVRQVVGVYLGPERFLSRKSLCIERNNVVVFGVDAVLVTRSDTIIDSGPACESALWRRRDQLHGQQVATAGGTKVGTVDDIIVDEEMSILGFSLARVSVEGPVAANRAVARDAVIEFDDVNEVVIIDLSQAEQQTLSAG